jgi:hypothetical protein
MSLILSGLLILGLLTLLVHRAYTMGRNAGLEHGAASASDRLIEKFREG